MRFTWFRRGMLPVFVLLLGVAAMVPARADALFQYSVPFELSPDRDGNPRTGTAYLWIPPTAERIRGLIVGGQLSAEGELVQDPSIRAAAAAEKLAIIYMTPHVDAIFNYKEGKGPQTFLKILDDLANVSGYREIAVAPFFSMGHSTSCNFATAVACWQPTRCFGVLVFKGGLVLPSYDPQADISGIPILAVKGQFEEFGPGPSGVLRDFEDRETSWKSSRDSYLRRRAENERMLISLIVEAGTTHMASSPEDARYIALFIRKAAQARIPDWPVQTTEPVKCKEIDITTGALTSTAITNPSAPKTAPYQEYKGDKKSAYWHVDMELAQAFDAFHAGKFNKRPQFVAFKDSAGKTIYSRHDLRYSVTPTFVGPDTFKLVAGPMDEVRDRYAQPEGPIGHANGPIQFRRFGGAFEQVGPDTFRIRRNALSGWGGAITAYQAGDATFRFAEQPAGMTIQPNDKGKEQAIAFPPIGNLKRDNAPVELGATSDSGLPVSYYVKCGPAVIEDGKLKIADIPPRAKFPIPVEVVGYQWGSSVEPYVKTAELVSQTIMIEQ